VDAPFVLRPRVVVQRKNAAQSIEFGFDDSDYGDVDGLSRHNRSPVPDVFWPPRISHGCTRHHGRTRRPG
jgi:hypothetical protein